MRKIAILAFFCLGIFPIYSATTITSMLLREGVGTTSPIRTSLIVGKDMALEFTVKDTAGFANIDYIRVVIQDTNYMSSTNAAYYARFIYHSTPEISWSGLYWSIQPAYCEPVSGGSAGASTNQTVKLAFRISDSAMSESTNSWKISIVATTLAAATVSITNYYKMTKYQKYVATNKGNFYVYPNPLSSTSKEKTVTFVYSEVFSGSSKITLDIFDMAGRPVKNIVKDKVYASGSTLSESWDAKNEVGEDVLSGIYLALLKIKTDSSADVKNFKIAIIR